MSNNDQRDELALDIFLADNGNIPEETLLKDWADAPDRHRPYAQNIAAGLIAKGYRKPRTITTVDELEGAIIRAFEEGENLVLLNGWRPWIIWENDQGEIRVSSLPVEGDPDRLSLDDITLPATVIHEPTTEATK